MAGEGGLQDRQDGRLAGGVGVGYKVGGTLELNVARLVHRIHHNLEPGHAVQEGIEKPEGKLAGLPGQLPVRRGGGGQRQGKAC